MSTRYFTGQKKKILKASAALLSLLLVLTSPGYTLESIQHFYITQERSENNGILVSKPNSLDLKVLDIIQLNQIQSLEDYAQWLQRHVRYKQDGAADEWSAPEETLIRRLGDCEDYAFLNASVLKVLGYQPKFLALQRPGRAHAICVFKMNGYYLWFDNARLMRTQANTLTELAQHLTETYHYSQLFELNLNTKDWTLLYQAS